MVKGWFLAFHLKYSKGLSHVNTVAELMYYQTWQEEIVCGKLKAGV